MNQLLLKKLLTSGLFLILAISSEIFLFVYLGIGVLPTYFALDIGLMLFITFVIFFAKDGWVANLILFFFFSCQLILSYMNIVINTMLADVFTFDMLSLVTETVEVFHLNMLTIWPAVFYILLLGMAITAACFLNKIKITKESRTKLRKIMYKNVALWGVTLAFCLHSIGIFTIKGKKNDELYLLSDRVLYESLSSNRQSLIKFGTYGYYFEEFFRKFVKTGEVVKFTRNELNAFISSNQYNPVSSNLWEVSKGQNVIVIMAESFEWYAISEELTPTLYALANGYDFGTLADGYKNFNFYDFDLDNDGITDIDSNGFTLFSRKDYTYDEINKTYTKNILDDSDIENIIYQALFEDETLFSKYGLTLSSYYSKAKTDYSEASVLLGNYPYNESFTTHGGLLGFNSTGIYPKINYGFSLPNMLKDSEAVDSTTYLHSYLSTFYGRDTLMRKFGFDNTLFLDQMSSVIARGGSINNATLDSQVLDYYLNQADNSIIPSDKTTLTFFTTVTTHGDYGYNPLLKNHYDFINSEDVEFFGKDPENKLVADIALNYITSALDTEYMMTILVKYLMENGLFDNTTIVFFSDHQSYYSGLDLTLKSEYYTKLNEDIEDYEYTTLCSDRFNVPSFIYSTAINDDVVGEYGHNVTKLTNAFDLTTTIMTLLGVRYNPNFYYGYPVQCNIDGTEFGQYAILSPTGGVFNENIYTDDGKTILHTRLAELTPDEITKFSLKVAQAVERRYKVTALYKYNMFNSYNNYMVK